MMHAKWLMIIYMLMMRKDITSNVTLCKFILNSPVGVYFIIKITGIKKIGVY